MANQQLFSVSTEKHALSALAKHTSKYADIAGVVKEDAFYHPVHKIIFRVVSSYLEARENLNYLLVSNKIKALGISTFDDDADIENYVKAIFGIKVNIEAYDDFFKELLLLKVKRDVISVSEDIVSYINSNETSSLPDILKNVDGIYTSGINKSIKLGSTYNDIAKSFRAKMEDRADNPPDPNRLIFGPIDSINNILGSLHRPGNVTCIGARSGAGKMMPHYVKIKTPTGWITHGDIKVGDIVSCPDGTQSNVVRVFPQGKKDLYRIHLADGRCVDSGLEHLWRIFARDTKGNYNWMMADTKEVIRKLTHKTGRVFLPLISGEPSAEKDKLPINPYVIGVLIGDGCLSRKSITTTDDFIYNTINSIYPCGKKSFDKRSQNNLYSFTVKSPLVRRYLKEEFKNAKSHQKFIPQIYKNASREDRFNLLRGLMDTDGTVGRSTGRNKIGKFYGTLEYSTSSGRLAYDVQELVWSLGGVCKVTSRYTFYTYKGEKKHGRLSYRVKIRFTKPSDLFLLPRKKDKLSGPYQYEDLKVRVIKIEKLDIQEECSCIMIDHPEHLYIVDNYIITHNTSLSLYYNIHVAIKYNLPILWCDFGEMSPEELQDRMAACLTNGLVPLTAVERGVWRKNPEHRAAMMKAFEITDKMSITYVDISYMSPIEIISYARRFKFNKIGRDNNFIWVFDYLKPFDSDDHHTPEWKAMGKFIKDIKSFIQGELNTSFWTSLQLNKSGITNGRHSSQLDDSENTFGIADRIIQQCTHGILLRNKVRDELESEQNRFGNIILKWLKYRHLGVDIRRALDHVELPSGKYQQNHINLHNRNFYFEDRGDLNDQINAQNNIVDIQGGVGDLAGNDDPL